MQALIVLLYWNFIFLASFLFRLINANISVNEQPEWFHWAHRRWPFYAYLRHVHVLDHGHFTDIVSPLAIYISVPPVISEKNCWPVK
jgi:hypothetical protein